MKEISKSLLLFFFTVARLIFSNNGQITYLVDYVEYHIVLV